MEVVLWDVDGLHGREVLWLLAWLVWRSKHS